MSYVKLFKVVQDFALGFQTLNQARDNNDALLAQLDARHSIGAGGQSPPSRPFDAVGRHDDPLIARTVAHFRIDDVVIPTRLRAAVTGPMLSVLVAQQLQVGQWQIFVSTPSLFAAVATPAATSAVDRKANCYLTQSPSQGASVIVSTWDRSGGSWAKTDFDFSLVMWGQRY